VARLITGIVAPYRHFATHEALVAEVATRGFERLEAALATAGDDLEKLGTAYVAFAVANPQHYRAMYALPRDRANAEPELAAASGRTYARLQAAVDRRIAHDGGHLPGPTAALAAWAYVHGLASLAIDGIAAQEVSEHGGDLATVLTRGL